jgi:hypothetical protein
VVCWCVGVLVCWVAEYGPFDLNNEEVFSPQDGETLPRLVDKTHRRKRAGKNLAAATPNVWGDGSVLLQTEQRVHSRSRSRSRNAMLRGAGAGAVPRALELGGRTFHRVNPLARTHESPHFHHLYRSEQLSREAVEAEAARDRYDPLTTDSAAAYPTITQWQEQQQPYNADPYSAASLIARSAHTHRTAAAAADSQNQMLPTRPRAQFPSPPLNLDRFDPFDSQHKRVPNAPPRYVM